jgi:hypothetical protein
MKKAIGIALGVGFLLAGMAMPNTASALAPEPDLLKIKGFSPEVIQVTETQRSRQEWRTPQAPTLSPMGRFVHNIYYNDWIGSLDAFGDSIIRNRQ